MALETIAVKAVLNVGAATAIGSFADWACQQIEIYIGGKQAVERKAKQAAEEQENDQEEEGYESGGIPVHVRKDSFAPWEEAIVRKDGKVYLSEGGMSETESPDSAGSPLSAWKHARQKYDCMRTCRFALSFGVLGGANSFVWYNYVLPPLSNHSFWKMLAFDVGIYNAYFLFVGLAANECLRSRRIGADGRSVDRSGHTVCEAICQRYWPTYLLAQSVMIPADLVMFSVIPRVWRVVYIKSVDVLWMTGASYLANRPLEDAHAPAAEQDVKLPAALRPVGQPAADGGAEEHGEGAGPAA